MTSLALHNIKMKLFEEKRCLELSGQEYELLSTMKVCIETWAKVSSATHNCQLETKGTKDSKHQTKFLMSWNFLSRIQPVHLSKQLKH